MVRRNQTLQTPTSRRFHCLTFTDSSQEDAELLSLSAEVDEAIARLRTAEGDERDAITKEVQALQEKVVNRQAPTRRVWVVKRRDPVAMAFYAWAYDQREALACKLRESGREMATFAEWQEFEIVPRAGVLALCWHDLQWELELGMVDAIDPLEFRRFSTDAMDEFEDGPFGVGLGVEDISTLGTEVLNVTASLYLGLSRQQERADFLGVRPEQFTGQLSESA